MISIQLIKYIKLTTAYDQFKKLNNTSLLLDVCFSLIILPFLPQKNNHFPEICVNQSHTCFTRKLSRENNLVLIHFSLFINYTHIYTSYA